MTEENPIRPTYTLKLSDSNKEPVYVPHKTFNSHPFTVTADFTVGMPDEVILAVLENPRCVMQIVLRTPCNPKKETDELEDE